MAENVDGIRIESAYGLPGEIGWSYHAIDLSNNSIILEGEVEREGRIYHMLLRPNEGGREELGDIENPFDADERLKELLILRASGLLDSKKK